MAKIKPEDVQLWAGLIPTIGPTIASVISIFRMVRRAKGEPEEQPGDEAAAEAILAAVRAQTVQKAEDAKDPWLEMRDVARQQTGRA